MKILYVMGTGSKHNDIELKWSLRSVAKYAKSLPHVVIAGHCPAFIDKEKVTWIAPDLAFSTGHKHDNMCDKIVRAVETGVCTEPFLLSSDDHFFVREVDFENYPFYVRPHVYIPDKSLELDRCTAYAKTIQKTRRQLLRFGIPIFHFNGHFNTWVNPECVSRVQEFRARAHMEGDFGLEPTLLFANVHKFMHPEQTLVRREDLKISDWSSELRLLSLIGERDSFSISDSVFNNPDFSRTMEQWFPEASPFELVR